MMLSAKEAKELSDYYNKKSISEYEDEIRLASEKGEYFIKCEIPLDDNSIKILHESGYKLFTQIQFSYIGTNVGMPGVQPGDKYTYIYWK